MVHKFEDSLQSLLRTTLLRQLAFSHSSHMRRQASGSSSSNHYHHLRFGHEHSICGRSHLPICSLHNRWSLYRSTLCISVSQHLAQYDFTWHCIEKAEREYDVLLKAFPAGFPSVQPVLKPRQCQLSDIASALIQLDAYYIQLPISCLETTS